MWVIRELVRLVLRVAVGIVFALVVAVLWAAVSGHSFGQDLRVTTLSVGIVLLLMAAIGRRSNFDRAMDFGAAHQYWGHVPGMSSIQRTGEDPTLTPGAVFASTGTVLLALGRFVL